MLHESGGHDGAREALVEEGIGLSDGDCRNSGRVSKHFAMVCNAYVEIVCLDA